DEIADEGILRVREFLLHLELLEFVAGKDDQPARLVAGDHRLDEMLAETAGAAGDQNRLLVQVHPGLGEVAQRRGRRSGFGNFRRNGKRGQAHTFPLVWRKDRRKTWRKR